MRAIRAFFVKDVVLLFTWSIEPFLHFSSLSPLYTPLLFLFWLFFIFIFFDIADRGSERAMEDLGSTQGVCVFDVSYLVWYYFFLRRGVSVRQWSQKQVSNGTGTTRKSGSTCRLHSSARLCTFKYFCTNNSCFDQLITNMNMEAKKSRPRPDQWAQGTPRYPLFILSLRSPCTRPICLLIRETE